MAQCKLIRNHIENLLNYLEPFLGLANCHMVDYFSQNSYNTHIPEKIRNEINSFGKSNTIDSIFNNELSKLPNLEKYVEDCKSFIVKNNTDVCFNKDTFYEELKRLGCKDLDSMKLNIFMTSKKSHEVEVLGLISAAVKSIANTSHLIDIGDGKGYLSSVLALHYKIPVLGVDASEINTNGAVKRIEKLAKVWNSVTVGEKSKDTTKNLYKQITQFVDENSNFQELMETVFLEKSSDLGLVGLHTCGNLAAASIRIFHSSEHIKTICNVGCCYHFINEQFEEDCHRINKNKTSQFGFPMSNFLIEKETKIGRSARMIAAQSVDRIFDKRELPNKSIFYRALLEILVKKHYPEIKIKDVGRFRKPANDFLDYTRKALKRLNLEIDLQDKDIEDINEEFETRIHELNVFYLIRCMLSPVIESLILLDRLLFLQEHGHQAYLVQMFDPVVSPRCYGVIAFK